VNSQRRQTIAVIGSSDADERMNTIARQVGALIAREGFALLTGGLGGVMEAASRGAAEAGGTVVGVLPTDSIADANPYVQIAIATGCGQGRNVMLINSADAVIAVGKGFGTLSEIALALRAGKPIAAIGSWIGIDPAIHVAADAEDAIRLVRRFMTG
jgi:uncharacterized protein (TIGR00725 family)